MKETFIHTVSNWVLANYTNRLHNVVIVVPARRALRYITNDFEKYFHENGKAGFIPEVLTINELFERCSPRTKLSGIELQFHFYELYCTLEHNPEAFEKFFNWSSSLLADFNEIDNYLLNYKEVFTDLRNIHEIDEWSFLLGELSRGQQQLNEFWNKLPEYYSAWKKYMYEKRIGSSGSINRELCEKPDIIENSYNNRFFVFVGFNALTRCEQEIMNYLESKGKAAVFFDEDGYYVNNSNHEAGLFLREYKRLFGKETHFVDAKSLGIQPKNFTIYECSGEIVQSKKLAEVLRETSKKELTDSCVVLCNEQMLPVIVSHLPDEVANVNVTMGWPLKFTAVSDFVLCVLDICVALGRNSNFIHKDEINRLSVAVKNLFPEIKLDLEKVFSVTDFFNAIDGSPLKSIISIESGNTLKFLRTICRMFEQQIPLEKNKISSEVLSHFVQLFRKMEQIPGIEKYISSWYLFKQLVVKFMRNHQLSFIGEPLSGVQLMGMLETRGLDFETVFILSANEGFLPAQSTSSSFIPYDLKQYHKLPGKAEQDAVFAYYFYRLIQRAKNIHIFYNTQNEALMQAEKSRYLLQLEHELLEKENGSVINYVSIVPQSGNVTVQQKFIKDSFYFNRLRELEESGFTASQLNTYLKCNLDFYFKYILKFREEKNEPELEESDVGNIIHFYFERLFLGMENKHLQTKLFLEAIDTCEELIASIMKEKYSRYNCISGSNYLTVEIIKEMIKVFLKNQLQPQGVLVNKILVGTELQLATEIVVDNTKKIKIKGTIDLLLKNENNEYFIFDFKSGRAEEGDVRISRKTKGSKMVSLRNKGKFIQLAFYRLLVNANYLPVNCNAYIIPIGKGSRLLYEFSSGPENETELMNLLFSEILIDMYATEIAVEHNSKNKYCEFCN